MSTVQDIPRTIVNAEIRVARLPFEAFTRLAGPKDDTVAWAPALVADTVEATVRQWAGTILRDETLQRDAELLRAKVTKLRDAAAHEAEAKAKRQQAEQNLESREQAADRQRQQAEQRAQEQERKLDQERNQEKARIRKEADQRKQAADKAERERQRQLDTKEATARLRTLETEQHALAQREEALRTEEEAARLEGAAKAARAARKR